VEPPAFDAASEDIADVVDEAGIPRTPDPEPPRPLRFTLQEQNDAAAQAVMASLRAALRGIGESYRSLRDETDAIKAALGLPTEASLELTMSVIAVLRAESARSGALAEEIERLRRETSGHEAVEALVRWAAETGHPRAAAPVSLEDLLERAVEAEDIVLDVGPLAD
jgi:hypothetical protein